MLPEAESLNKECKNEDGFETLIKGKKQKKTPEKDGKYPGGMTKNESRSCHTITTTSKKVGDGPMTPEQEMGIMAKAVSELFQEDSSHARNDVSKIIDLCKSDYGDDSEDENESSLEKALETVDASFQICDKLNTFSDTRIGCIMDNPRLTDDLVFQALGSKSSGSQPVLTALVP